jgi:hypothetical protein
MIRPLFGNGAPDLIGEDELNPASLAMRHAKLHPQPYPKAFFVATGDDLVTLLL